MRGKPLIKLPSMVIIKSEDGRIEPFDREKHLPRMLENMGRVMSDYYNNHLDEFLRLPDTEE